MNFYHYLWLQMPSGTDVCSVMSCVGIFASFPEIALHVYVLLLVIYEQLKHSYIIRNNNEQPRQSRKNSS